MIINIIKQNDNKYNKTIILLGIALYANLRVPRALMTLWVVQFSLKIAHFLFFIMAPTTAGCYIQKHEKKLRTQISYSPSDRVISKLP